jgi:hypothetical protein
MSVSTYHDYFGNRVTFYSMTLRHERLSIINRVTVRTKETPPTSGALDATVAEARQLFASRLTDIFDYSQPTPAVPTGIPSMDWVRKFFPDDAPIGEALEQLNRAIYDKFRYAPGSTHNSTPLESVFEAAGRRLPGLHASDARRFAYCRISGALCVRLHRIRSCEARRRRSEAGCMACHARLGRGAHSGHALDCNRSDEQQWWGQRHVTMAYGRDSVMRRRCAARSRVPEPKT